jgi:hypothetical protein
MANHKKERERERLQLVMAFPCSRQDVAYAVGSKKGSNRNQLTGDVFIVDAAVCHEKYIE